MSRGVLAVMAGACFIAFDAHPAGAACHAFEVTAQPASVAEGAAVQVTVSRDGAVGTSQIDVETVDGTARGGTDYEAVARRTISFTNETSQTFPIPTRDDAERESAETFRVRLSNPGGCTVNPNFSVGPDATVTIGANDEPAAAPQTTRPGAATTAPRPGSTAPTPSSAPPAADATLESTTAPPTLPPIPRSTADGSSTTRAEDAIALAEDDQDGGLGAAAVVVALAAAAALGGAGWWTWQRRRGAPIGP